jgi:hypothetical protein
MASSVAPTHRTSEIGRLTTMPIKITARPVICTGLRHSGHSGSTTKTKDRPHRSTRQYLPHSGQKWNVISFISFTANGPALREPRQRRHTGAGRSNIISFYSGQTPPPSVMRNCPQIMSIVLDYPSFIVRTSRIRFGALRAPSWLSLIRAISVIRGESSPFRAFRVFRKDYGKDDRFMFRLSSQLATAKALRSRASPQLRVNLLFASRARGNAREGGLRLRLGLRLRAKRSAIRYPLFSTGPRVRRPVPRRLHDVGCHFRS